MASLNPSPASTSRKPIWRMVHWLAVKPDFSKAAIWLKPNAPEAPYTSAMPNTRMAEAVAPSTRYLTPASSERNR